MLPKVLVAIDDVGENEGAHSGNANPNSMRVRSFENKDWRGKQQIQNDNIFQNPSVLNKLSMFRRIFEVLLRTFTKRKMVQRTTF